MGGLVASDMCVVKTLRRGAFMHFCDITTYVFEKKGLSIYQLDVGLAMEGSQ